MKFATLQKSLSTTEMALGMFSLIICTCVIISFSDTSVVNNGGFHLHLLGFPFVYQFELQIELEPKLLVQNPVELI